MKAICILSGGILNDGITNSVLLYYKYMDKENIRIDILQNNDPDELMQKKIVESGIFIRNVGKRNKLPGYFLNLMKLIKREKYDIVHVHGSSALMTIELLAAKLGGCKVRIAHSRNTTCSHMKIDRFLRPLFHLLCTSRLACGEDAGKWLFDNHEFTIMHAGKNFPDYKFSQDMREKIRRERGWENHYVIGHVGNFNYQKNHEFLIKTFAKLAWNNQKYMLVLMGMETENGYFAKAENLVKTYRLEKQVVFMGSIDHVPEMLQAMDLMLLPSFFEGLPNVVLEWQIAGLPCIISDTITKECTVTDFVKYLPIDQGESMWMEEIIYQEAHSVDRKKNSVYACEKLAAGFDIHKNSQVLKQLYTDLVG